MFNEGHSASSGPHLIRADLCNEAIRLTRILDQMMPEEPEVVGLLALMLLHHARRNARVNGNGDLITLEEQDRDRWDTTEIGEGLRLLEAALKHRQVGPYQLQAAIVACHARAETVTHTDWAEIARLYALLERQTPSPVIRLNRAVAVSMSGDIDLGLAIVHELTDNARMQRFYLFHATHADLLRRRGDHEPAAAAYERALLLAPTEAARRFLQNRLNEVWPSSSGGVSTWPTSSSPAP
jgi:RNA polymerase sigma-70 factor, ECF subfamily